MAATGSGRQFRKTECKLKLKTGWDPELNITGLPKHSRVNPSCLLLLIKETQSLWKADLAALHVLSTGDLQSRFRAWLPQGNSRSHRQSREAWPRAGFSPVKWLSDSFCLVTTSDCHHHTSSTRATSAQAAHPARTQARAELLLPDPRGSGPCASALGAPQNMLPGAIGPTSPAKPHVRHFRLCPHSASFLTHCMPSPQYFWCFFSVISRCLCVKRSPLVHQYLKRLFFSNPTNISCHN